MNDVRIVLTFSDITKSKASLNTMSTAFYGCKGNTFSRHRQIFMQKSLLSPSPLRGHPLTGDRFLSGSDPHKRAAFLQGKPCTSQHLQPLLTVRRGFRPLPKPLANLWQGDVIDYGDWSPPSRFWYGSPAFVPSGFAMITATTRSWSLYLAEATAELWAKPIIIILSMLKHRGAWGRAAPIKKSKPTL